MKEKLKNRNQGITLIALIITIIVMLILVVTAVSVTINSGLFEKAGEATREWKANEEAEQELANGQVTINNKAYNNIEEYIEESNQITFYIIRMDIDSGEEETLDFTVPKGTTWEVFLSENPIYENQTLGICGVDGTYFPPECTGAYFYGASAPAYELPGNNSTGPWIYPDDPIKNGVTYNWYLQ